jgi:ubiquinone/menaquinone biosynthesis C-methylase UbiE
MDALGIRTGMVIADVGAGKEYFTFKLAKRVGLDEKIYATDIEEGPLKAIRDRAKNEGFDNIKTILGKPDNPNLPKGRIDIILMVHVFHIVIDNQDPLVLPENIKSSLKPDGLVALVQWDGKKWVIPISLFIPRKVCLKSLKTQVSSLSASRHSCQERVFLSSAQDKV